MEPRFTVVIVANERYLVDPGAEQPVGAASFIEAVTAELATQGAATVHYIGFRRDEEVSLPRLSTDQAIATLFYNFKMPADAIERLISDHLSRLASPGRPLCVWYQSPVLVPFHPRGWRGLVTHHAPFVTEVEKRLPPKSVRDAFQDLTDKTDVLRLWQAAGVDRLVGDSTLASVEFSSVQVAALRNMGVPPDRIHQIAPRFIKEPASALSPEAVTDARWLLDPSCDLRLLTCCARVDGFKNLRSLVEAVDTLSAAGLSIRALIACGSDHSEALSRAALIRGLSSRTAGAIRLRPRYRQGEFLSLARKVALEAIFVLPSTYETFGITPVQASLMGMPVILKDDPGSIGCLPHIGIPLRYDGTTSALADLLSQYLSILPEHNHQEAEFDVVDDLFEVLARWSMPSEN
jgi:glycosyltransferase involved in cell wall biosynthesis